MSRRSLTAALCLASTSLLSGCGFWLDALVPCEPDAGSDAFMLDSGTADSGTRDAGIDAWMLDAAAIDVSTFDGGPDAYMCNSADDCTAVGDSCNPAMCVVGACVAAPRDCNDDDVCTWESGCVAGDCPHVRTDCHVRGEGVATGRTPTVGGSLGSAFEDPCPTGQVMIGYEASLTYNFYDQLLRGYRTICGRVEVSETAVVTITAGDVVPAVARGNYEFGVLPTRITCPANQVVVGFDGSEANESDSAASASLFLSRLTLRCAPLTARGTMEAGFVAEVGAAMPGPTLGTRGSRIASNECASGVAVGSYGNNGEVIDRLGLLCGNVALTVITTAPPAGTRGPEMSEFRDDCPWGQVPVGVIGGVSALATGYDQNLTQFRTVCAPLSISPTGGDWTVSIGMPTPAPFRTWGSVMATVTPQMCPLNEAIVGYQGAGDSAMTRLVIRCAQVTATGAAPTFSFVGAEPLPALGTRLSPPLTPALDCPAGLIGRGFFGTAGPVVNALALRCSVPTFFRR
jgi:hypothetical protein